MRSGQHAGAAALLAPPLLSEFAQLGERWCVCSGVEAAPRRGRGRRAGACPAAGEVEGPLGHGANGGLMCLYLHACLGFCGAVLARSLRGPVFPEAVASGPASVRG